MATLEERLRSRLTSVVQQVAQDVSVNTFSGYLVKRLIVEGSFRNTFSDDGAIKGFQIQVKNKLGVSTIIGCTPVKIDGEPFGVEQIVIQKKGQTLRASEINDSMPIVTSFGDEMMIFIEDAQGLGSGKHDVELGLNLVGLGIIQVKFDEALNGKGCGGRARKAAPAGEDDFADVVRRTIGMAAAHIGAAKLAECAATVRGIVLDLSDMGVKYGIRLDPDGTASFEDGPLDGDKILTIRTTREAFHAMAHNRLNPGIAYARGDIRLEGIPVLKLRGMDPLITAIFQGYRAASDGLEFDAAPGGAAGGVLEDMLGMMFTALDEILKMLDKILGTLGRNYFYEKSLNRIEWLWDILDREMRKMVMFGRGDAGGDVVESQPKAPARAPAAPTLTDRLRQRISTAVESAVSEIARASVSGYLVKRLIKPGSFRNFEENGEAAGFEVRLKNKLGTGTIIGFTDIKLDGTTYALDQIEITKDRKVIPASDVSENKPLLVEFGDELLIRVRQPGGIGPGAHRVTLGVNMVGVGGMDVDYQEKLSA